jgi:hypothetical protein
VEEVSYVFRFGNGESKVDVDHFGQINWIHITEAAHIYTLLNIALRHAYEHGPYTEFWKF